MTHHITCRIEWSDGHQADPDDCQDCLDAERGVCAGCLDDERDTAAVDEARARWESDE